MIKQITTGCYNLLTARGDRLRFLKRIAKICKPFVDEGGILSSRIFYLKTWGDDEKKPFQPWPVIGYWDADYHDEPATCPVFDLGTPAVPHWNEQYWEEFRRVHEWLRDLGFSVHGVLEDFCSLKKDGRAKYWHPIRSNAQRVPNWAKDIPKHEKVIPNSWYGAEIWPYYRAYFLRVVKELRALKIGFALEPMNEADVEEMPAWELLTWHNRAVKLLRECGLAQSALIASASRCAAEIASTVGTFSCHGHATAKDIRPDYFGIPASKIEVSTDGGFGGLGRPDYKKRRGPSGAQGRAMIQRMKQLGYSRFEYFDRGIEGPAAAMPGGVVSKVWADVDLFNGGSLKAFVDEAAKS
jgi:hypothetical protein